MNQNPNNLGDVFVKIASENKDNIAIMYSDNKKITYSNLNNISNNINSKFLSLNLIKGDRILISGDKSPLMFGAIIASLKAGIIYSIFDPDMPDERLKGVVITCAPHLLIGSSEKHISIANKSNVEYMFLSELEDQANNHKKPTLLSKNDLPSGADVAYIVFTSGSTGTPKGAVMTHANVLSLIDWSKEEFSFGPGEVLTNLNPCYFDNFVFDFYSSIFTGATIVPFTQQEIRNPSQLITTISELGCTSWFSVPSLLIYLDTMKAFSEVRLPKLRRFVFGGEGYPKSKLFKLYEQFEESVSFYNVYGPSECTCIASCYKVSEMDFDDMNGFLPLGSLINGFDYFIVDENLKVTPHNEKGELCLLGPAVGLGYFNQSEITKRSFIPKERLEGETGHNSVYRTGDVVTFDSSDKKLYIFGRKDNQIKHMGYRIELEDIENALMRLPYISQACCVHNYKNESSRIFAYLAVEGEHTSLKIKLELSNLLPIYMIPTNFIFLNIMPKNKNGKIDRKALKDLN